MYTQDIVSDPSKLLFTNAVRQSIFLKRAYIGIPLSHAISNYSIVSGTSYVIKQDLLDSLVY